MVNIGIAALLILLVGSITSILSKKLKIAYAELLITAGLLISIVYGILSTEPTEATGEFIISVVLPPLVFQAALMINYSIFKRVQKTVVLLAVVSVAVSALICAMIIVSFTPLTLIPALAFGVIISPTDAAAVVDAFKRVKAPKELGTIVEGESLLNDATALALFSAVSALTLNPLIATLDIAREFAGGLVVGLVLGFLAIKALPMADENAQVMITLAVAYGSYLLADALSLSGIVAVAITGLLIGRNWQKSQAKEAEAGLLIGFWRVLAFIVTTVAFVFIGLTADVGMIARYVPLIAICFLAALAARYLSIESILLPASKFIGLVPRTWRNVTWLAGIRGAVSVALALSLPEFPFKSTIVAITFGVVLLSLLVQTRLLSYYIGKRIRANLSN